MKMNRDGDGSCSRIELVVMQTEREEERIKLQIEQSFDATRDGPGMQTDKPRRHAHADASPEDQIDDHAIDRQQQFRRPRQMERPTIQLKILRHRTPPLFQLQPVNPKHSIPTEPTRPDV